MNVRSVKPRIRKERKMTKDFERSFLMFLYCQNTPARLCLDEHNKNLKEKK